MSAGKKKSLGIIGGMGSYASSWMLERIIQLSGAQSDQDNLEIMLHNNSSIPDRTQAIVYDHASPLPELKRTVSIFNMLNIEVAIMACMTAHHYYDEISRDFNGCMLNAVDIVLAELRENPALKDKRRIGLIGTSGTIKARILHDKLEANGYKIIVLEEDELEEYFMGPLYKENGIKAGVVNAEIISRFSRTIDILISRNAEFILGACSEVPLIIPEVQLPVPFIDTFELLALKAVQYCYNQEEIQTHELNTSTPSF